MIERREVAQKYARLIYENSNDIQAINECRENLKLKSLEGQDATFQITEHLCEGERNIGIWHKEAENSEFYTKNKRYENEYNYWCRNKKIPDGKKGKRIILIGESVARGFLYDPHFTPAKYLEYLLNYYTEEKNYEIIDLARLGMTIEIMIRTIKQCLKLKPDLIILFAGNNFRESIFLSEKDKEEYISSIKHNNQINQINKIIEKKMEGFIAELFLTIKNVNEKNNIPFLYIIPEFNLKDWESNNYEKEQYLITDNPAEWNTLFKHAEMAFESKDFKTAKEKYLKLIDINPVYTYAYEKIAQIYELEHERKKARSWYQNARDSRYLNWSRASVCTSTIRDKIIKYANKCNCITLDLQEKFHELMPESIPGKNLFLDNCHMSSKGIMISMQLAADNIARMLENKPINSAVFSDDNGPDHNIEANARFCAAIYNAHIGAQSFNSLYEDIKQAYKYNPQISQLMIKYLNLASKKIPWVLNRDYEELLSEHFTIMAQMDECRILDIPLCNAMLKVLKEDAGIDIISQINYMRIENFGPHNGKINMLEPYFRENSYVKSVGETFYEHNTEQHLFVRFTGPISIFHLISNQTYSLSASIVMRIIKKNQTVKIFVNDNYITDCCVADCWTRHEFIINKEYLRDDGLNQLAIYWPEIDQANRNNNDVVMLNKCLYGEIIQFDITEKL